MRDLGICDEDDVLVTFPGADLFSILDTALNQFDVMDDDEAAGLGMNRADCDRLAQRCRTILAAVR